MTKFYTAMVSQSVLDALGWNVPCTYAEVLDYLIENHVFIHISLSCESGCFDLENWINNLEVVILKAIKQLNEKGYDKVQV